MKAYIVIGSLFYLSRHRKAMSSYNISKLKDVKIV